MIDSGSANSYDFIIWICSYRLLWYEDGRVASFPQTITALGAIPAIVYRALEFGTSQNRQFFELLSEKEAPRPHIREIIVRDQAKRFLERSDFQVEDETLTVGNEPLSALILRCGPAQLRVLKGIGGIIPGCGDSLRRRRFYSQVPNRYIDRKGLSRQTRLNLLVLWDFDKAFNVAGLWLVCPMRGGERSEDVLFFWHEPIQHPATLPSATAEAREQAEEELEKLLRDEEPEPESGTEEA